MTVELQLRLYSSSSSPFGIDQKLLKEKESRLSVCKSSAEMCCVKEKEATQL